MGTMSCWGVVAVLAAMVLVAGSGEAQTTKDCTAAYNYLSSCLSYISSDGTTPSPACCNGISYLNTNDADCLCQIVNQFNTTTTPGVNATKAFALPSQCGIVVDTVKCPALASALAPGAAVAPTPPPPPPPPQAPGVAATPPSTAAPAAAALTGLFVAFTALLAATHLVWT